MKDSIIRALVYALNSEGWEVTKSEEQSLL